jgi:ferredoxin
MADPFELCVFCPRLCRHVCPVAVATGHESATPTAMMTAAYLGRKGLLDADSARLGASLCTGCGACTKHCLYHVNVAEILAAARQSLGAAPEVERPGPVMGGGEVVVVECDDRVWSAALAARMGRPMATLRTPDHLGARLLDHARPLEPHLRRLRALLGGRVAVTSCGACRRVLLAAELETRLLQDLVDLPWTGPVYASCRLDLPKSVPSGATRLPCCGGDPIFSAAHPELASDVAAEAARSLGNAMVFTSDSGCARTLVRAGARVMDPIDLLLRAATRPETPS